MNRHLFTPTSAEDTVTSLDAFRNDILGAAGFGLGLTALQFQPAQASAVASVAFLFLVFWAAMKLMPWSQEHDRYYGGLPFWQGAWRAIMNNLVLLAGLGFLGCIAFGLLTLEQLQSMAFSRLFIHSRA